MKNTSEKPAPSVNNVFTIHEKVVYTVSADWKPLRRSTMSTAKRIGNAGFYWIGVATTMVCFALVLAGDTELVWRFEHGGFPLSWAFAGTAVLAFLAAEFSHSDSSLPDGAEGLSSQPALEWEAAGFEG